VGGGSVGRQGGGGAASVAGGAGGDGAVEGDESGVRKTIARGGLRNHAIGGSICKRVSKTITLYYKKQGAGRGRGRGRGLIGQHC
jgi:hypothetical protein